MSFPFGFIQDYRRAFKHLLGHLVARASYRHVNKSDWILFEKWHYLLHFTSCVPENNYTDV